MASSETRTPGSRRAISLHSPSTLRTPIIHHPLGSGGGYLPPGAWLYQLQTSLDLRGHSSRPRGGGHLRGIKTPTPLPAPTRAGFQELGDRGKQRVKVARTERGNKRRRPRRPTVRGPASPPSPRGVKGARAAALLASRGPPPPPPPAHLTCDTELAGTGIRL